MKRIIFICLLCPIMTLAQKEIKPSVNKAEAALQKGNFDEAKAIIDVTVASQEFMVDKKGNPSKNASKAWYLKGLIYAAIDTTSVSKFKSLDPNPFAVAKESFEKCNCIYASYDLALAMTQDEAKRYIGEPSKVNPVAEYGGSDQWTYDNQNFLYFKNGKVVGMKLNSKAPLLPKSESYVNKIFLGQQVPMTHAEVAKTLAQKYIVRGYNTFKQKDYKAAFVDVDKVLFFVPNDTMQLMNVGVYFASPADEDVKAITYINKYLEEGGKNPDAYLQLYSIYLKKKDNESALKAIKELTSKYPDNVEYLNMEYNIYVQMNNIEEAKALMLKRAQGDLADTESRYFLVIIAKKQEKPDEARHWIEEILKINSDHFEANEEMVALLNKEQRTLNEQRNATTDVKKRLDLRNQRFAKLKEILPYAEKCVAVKPTDENSLYTLQSLYDNLGAYDEAYDKKSADLKKKMKSLGMEVD